MVRSMARVNHRVGLIVQARVGSSRLPGKSLMDLAGKPLVARILERLTRCNLVDELILAIPDTIENDPLENIGNDCGCTVYRGSENDLLDRYYQAAIEANASVIVRFPADNVTPEPKEIDKIIDYHLKENLSGFSTNLSQISSSGYPDGIGAEVFSLETLKRAIMEKPSSAQREHVHLNFLDYTTGLPVKPEECPVKTIECPPEYRRPDLVLDVNTIDQYQFAKALYDYLYPKNQYFSIVDTIHWYDNVWSMRL